MKNLLTVLFLVLAIQYCQAQNKSFHITGSIQGPCEGMVFKLLDNSYPPQTIATTVIKDHCFELTGEIPAPGFYRWIIDTTPVGKKSSEANWLAGHFYLEIRISLSREISILYPLITGIRNVKVR